MRGVGCDCSAVCGLASAPCLAYPTAPPLSLMPNRVSSPAIPSCPLQARSCLGSPSPGCSAPSRRCRAPAAATATAAGGRERSRSRCLWWVGVRVGLARMGQSEVNCAGTLTLPVFFPSSIPTCHTPLLLPASPFAEPQGAARAAGVRGTPAAPAGQRAGRACGPQVGPLQLRCHSRSAGRSHALRAARCQAAFLRPWPAHLPLACSRCAQHGGRVPRVRRRGGDGRRPRGAGARFFLARLLSPDVLLCLSARTRCCCLRRFNV